MKRLIARPKRRHRGSLRTKQRVRYVEAALSAVLADPELTPHVALLGRLFTPKRGRKVSVKQLSRALAARHPSTGKLLRKRVNAGLRHEGTSLVSNVCHGFDIPLAPDKSVSIAALVLRDETVLKLTLEAMRQAARWLATQMDRRLRRGGQNGTVATGQAAIFFIPEKAGRDGQPQLHAHLIIPNLTAYTEEDQERYCAAHFKRIAQSAIKAQQRMNRQLSRNLHKAGYAVELLDGVCRLPSVPRALCAEFSPASKRLDPSRKSANAVPRRSSKLAVRQREDRYLKDRPKKVLQSLAQWRPAWEAAIGADRFKEALEAYQVARLLKQQPTPAPTLPLAPESKPPSPRLAAIRAADSSDDVLDQLGAARPSFASLGATVRRKLETDLSHEARNQIVELDYVCTESARHLVEHTEALRTLLRIIFPRLIVHQKFSSAERSHFKITGAASGNPKFAQLVVVTAAALEVELGQQAVRANWPSVLRWLHAELASRVPEPVARMTPKARSKTRATIPVPKPPSPPPRTVTPPPPPVATEPITAEEPEWDLMP